jgi:uncharacterized protein
VKTPRPYSDPYLAGIGLGLVLLLAFVLVGRGLGASGAFATVSASAIAAAAPDQAATRPTLAERNSENGGNPARDWLVVEIIGVVIGAAVSARLAGRSRLHVESGPRITRGSRLLMAVAGGVVMAVGARLARGCTSGLGLTGGATMSVGAWLFIATAFAAAFAVAPLMRRAWR